MKSTLSSPKSIFVISSVILVLSFILVGLGGIVHNTDSSLACPDWPLCFGEWVPEMKGPVAIEHSHRLLATLVGLLSILLVWASKGTAFFERSLLILGLVVFQGLLGGLTVLLKINPIVSTLHLGTSQVFMAVVWWQVLFSFQQKDPQSSSTFSVAYDKKLRFIFRVAGGLLFLQILIGASIRHGGAGLSCGLGSESLIFCLDPHLGTPTLWPNTLAAKFHMFHRYLALVLCGALVFLMGIFLRTLRLESCPSKFYSNVKVSCFVLVIAVLLQVAIGLWTIYSSIAVIPVTAHLVMAMVVWLAFVKIYFDYSQIFLKNGLERKTITG